MPSPARVLAADTGPLDFGTGGHDDDVRGALGVDEHVSALLHAVLGLLSGLGENRDALTGQNHSGRQGVLLLEEVTVGFSGLVSVGRTSDLELRDGAEGSQELHRLVGAGHLRRLRRSRGTTRTGSESA